MHWIEKAARFYFVVALGYFVLLYAAPHFGGGELGKFLSVLALVILPGTLLYWNDFQAKKGFRD